MPQSIWLRSPGPNFAAQPAALTVFVSFVDPACAICTAMLFKFIISIHHVIEYVVYSLFMLPGAWFLGQQHTPLNLESLPDRRKTCFLFLSS